VSFGGQSRRGFGGIGAMVSPPVLRVRVSTAKQFSVQGPLAQRADGVAQQLVRLGRLPAELPCRIEVLEAPGEHQGLGVGTQVTLAVATALLRWFDRPDANSRVADVGELAVALGRGRRSAIGAHGFVQGGLLVDGGVNEQQGSSRRIAPLVARVEIPAAWRFVLLAPHDTQGLSGSAERAAFDHLPPVPDEVTAELCREILTGLLPAAVEADCDAFGESLYRYSRLAGSCYSSVQGGAYGSPRLEALVHRARELGARGVGQSSWGPTLFALLPEQAAAERFVERLLQSPEGAQLSVLIAAPDNAGVRVSVSPAGE
jgi:beta-RFAP synthase